MSQTWRLACAVRYIKREYIIVGTVVAISARIIQQWVDFNNICKNTKISHLHVPNVAHYVTLKEYMYV